jgi:hypothetical protein
MNTESVPAAEAGIMSPTTDSGGWVRNGPLVFPGLSQPGWVPCCQVHLLEGGGWFGTLIIKDKNSGLRGSPDCEAMGNYPK